MPPLSRKWLAVGLAALLILPLAVACSTASSEQGEPTSPAGAPETSASASRQDVLVSLTDALIVPRYQSVATETDRLRTALHDLCANPMPDTLATARNAWRDARAPWLRSQATWFGPVMERRSRSLVDWSPVDVERIERLLDEKDAVTAFDVREFLPATTRGLGAIEYVIFGDDAATLDVLASADSVRCQYLTALGDVAAEETAGLAADWAGYAGYFNGTASSSLLDRAAVDELVSASIFLTRSITDMRLGKALGADGGTPDPSAIPGGDGRNAVADLRNQALGMRDVYDGSGDGSGLGLDELVAGVSTEADERMAAAFEAVLAAFDGLEEPLQATVVNNPEPAREAHARLQELQRAWNTEVVSLLGVTVGFADTDGDGG